ncbi:52 kDa repressor of the inhibitor of the protein kinase-like [Xenia sp. Carnegie-2017]|uniref:52 kDa repressor of the inhibitor of the protein kinase-like n=1 Tax=Xenia sp. Carnegie-2017 TaxID=2897299 RepID=UPI001F04B83D|nr:52 kDa repressor of the inhibitor of the protein kinase-like [Xenia sp. Carnegie-2017]
MTGYATPHQKMVHFVCHACFWSSLPGKASKITNLFSKPVSRWNDAAFTFKRHDEGEVGLHAQTNPILFTLHAKMSGSAQPIELNKCKLSSIADCILFCGRLGLRGHRDDAKYHPEVGQYSTGGVGNFVETLNFKVRSGDGVLRDHLTSCGKNRSYISKTSQNKMIKCFGEVITEQIVNDIKVNRFFSIIADEAADSSHREQMALILRFIDKNMDIREEFIAFLQCKWELSGENLAKLILDKLKDLGLPIEDYRRQGYDGAGAVAGCVKGLAAQILKLNSKALYTHCYSHRLNLSVCDSLSDIEVKKVLNKIKDVTNFINISQTRNIPFEETVRNSLETDSKKTRLPDVCRTRWVERVKGLDTFEELFVQIFDTLDNMAKGGSPSLAADASSLLEGLSEFHFIALLVITRNVFDLTLPVTQLLQGKSIDVMDGIELISSLKSSVAHVRNSIDSYHDQWTIGRQTTRPNAPYRSISEYYKRIYTIPLIDHLLSSLDARFDTESVNVYQGLSIVPTKMFSLIKNGIDWRHKFKIVSKFYVADLPNQLGLDAELLLWQSFLEHRKGPYPCNVGTLEEKGSWKKSEKWGIRINAEEDGGGRLRKTTKQQRFERAWP